MRVITLFLLFLLTACGADKAIVEYEQSRAVSESDIAETIARGIDTSTKLSVSVTVADGCEKEGETLLCRACIASMYLDDKNAVMGEAIIMSNQFDPATTIDNKFIHSASSTAERAKFKLDNKGYEAAKHVFSQAEHWCVEAMDKTFRFFVKEDIDIHYGATK